MNKTFFTLLLSVLSVFALGFNAQAQDTEYFVKGFVYMPDGSPAQNAMVSITDQMNYSQTVYSGEDGSYIITDIPESVGSYFYFTVYDSNNEYCFEKSVTFTSTTGNEYNIQFVYFVKGIVYMPDGSVAKNAYVTIADGYNYMQSARTGEDGSYIITGIPESVSGSFYLTAYDSNWEYYFERSVTFPATTGNEYNIQLKGQTYMLYLFVRDTDGNPIEGVTVKIDGKEDVYTSDSEGLVFIEFYTFDEVIGLELTLSKDGYETLVLPVEWGMDFYYELVATMQPAAGPGPIVPGDVNEDGSVDISDVTALIDYLLSGTGTVNTDNADVNGDGSIDISDVTALIDTLLMGSSR